MRRPLAVEAEVVRGPDESSPKCHCQTRFTMTARGQRSFHPRRATARASGGGGLSGSSGDGKSTDLASRIAGIAGDFLPGAARAAAEEDVGLRRAPFSSRSIPVEPLLLVVGELSPRAGQHGGKRRLRPAVLRAGQGLKIETRL